jgi:hypothetical protein
VSQKRLKEKRLDENGWMIVSHQPPTVVNRWRRRVGARVVLELAIVVASCGAFGAPPEAENLILLVGSAKFSTAAVLYLWLNKNIFMSTRKQNKSKTPAIIILRFK